MRGLIGVRLDAKTRSTLGGGGRDWQAFSSMSQICTRFSLKKKVGKRMWNEERVVGRSFVDLYLVYLSFSLIPVPPSPNVKVVNFRHSWVIAVRPPVSHLSLPREKCRRCRVQISFGRCRARHALVNKLGDLTRASSPPLFPPSLLRSSPSFPRALPP